MCMCIRLSIYSLSLTSYFMCCLPIISFCICTAVHDILDVKIFIGIRLHENTGNLVFTFAKWFILRPPMFITEVSKVHTHTGLCLFIYEAIRTVLMPRNKPLNSYKRIDRCVLSSVAADALLLKHQPTSNHNAGEICIVFDQFDTKILHILWTISANEIMLWKMSRLFKGLDGLFIVCYFHVEAQSRMYSLIN